MTTAWEILESLPTGIDRSSPTHPPPSHPSRAAVQPCWASCIPATPSGLLNHYLNSGGAGGRAVRFPLAPIHARLCGHKLTQLQGAAAWVTLLLRPWGRRVSRGKGALLPDIMEQASDVCGSPWFWARGQLRAWLDWPRRYTSFFISIVLPNPGLVPISTPAPPMEGAPL